MDRIFEGEILNIIEEHHGKIVNFLREMVRVPSISGSRKEREIQNLIAEKLSSMNMKLDMWEPDPDELKVWGGIFLLTSISRIVQI